MTWKKKRHFYVERWLERMSLIFFDWPSVALCEQLSRVGMVVLFPIDLHLGFVFMFARVLLWLDWVLTIVVIPVVYETTLYTIMSTNVKTRFKQFWSQSCLWIVELIDYQACTLWFISKGISSMWYLLLCIYYLLIGSYPIHVLINLHLTSTKQMLTPFLILKLAWNNNKWNTPIPPFKCKL